METTNPIITQDYQVLPLDILIDHIETKHHRYIEQAIPTLQQYLEKICRVHGSNHGELFEIAELFNASATELMNHMKKEESKLFPYIRDMVIATNSGWNLEKPSFWSAKNPITVMIQEHDNEDERYLKIAKLCNEYNPPEDACNSYKKTFLLLQEFENDLREHMDLENTILFPKAIELESRLLNK